MQESRLFKIVYHLLDKGRATASELAEKFEVSVRTIYRDIDALSGAGIPIYAEAGRNGGIYLMNDFEDAIKEIVSGVEYEDEFYKHILDKMVVQDKDNIDVYLNLLPMKWSYTVAKASKKAVASEWNISEASLPMSVSRAFSSG